MRLTGGDTTLITCSVDGSICVWDVKNADGDKPPMFPDDVIISREDVRRKLDTIAALESRMHQLTVQSTADAAELTKAYDKRFQELDDMRSSQADLEDRHLQVILYVFVYPLLDIMSLTLGHAVCRAGRVYMGPNGWTEKSNRKSTNSVIKWFPKKKYCKYYYL